MFIYVDWQTTIVNVRWRSKKQKIIENRMKWEPPRNQNKKKLCVQTIDIKLVFSCDIPLPLSIACYCCRHHPFIYRRQQRRRWWRQRWRRSRTLSNRATTAKWSVNSYETMEQIRIVNNEIQMGFFLHCIEQNRIPFYCFARLCTWMLNWCLMAECVKTLYWQY